MKCRGCDGTGRQTETEDDGVCRYTREVPCEICRGRREQPRCLRCKDVSDGEIERIEYGDGGGI